jgi:hypothetical protein
MVSEKMEPIIEACKFCGQPMNNHKSDCSLLAVMMEGEDRSMFNAQSQAFKMKDKKGEEIAPEKVENRLESDVTFDSQMKEINEFIERGGNSEELASSESGSQNNKKLSAEHKEVIEGLVARLSVLGSKLVDLSVYVDKKSEVKFKEINDKLSKFKKLIYDLIREDVTNHTTRVKDYEAFKDILGSIEEEVYDFFESLKVKR